MKLTYHFIGILAAFLNFSFNLQAQVLSVYQKATSEQRIYSDKELLFDLDEDAIMAEASQVDNLPEPLIRLKEYIRIESITGNEKPAGEYLANLCRKKGLYVRVFSDQQDSYNFAASLFPLSSGKPNIILLNHIDVVPPGNSADWDHPPFSGHIDDEFIWGRGALDMKGMAIMQLFAILEFIGQEPLGFNVTLLAVSSEEALGTLGAQLVVNNHLEELNPVLVLGEGGAGVSGISQKNPEKQFFCVSLADKTALWIDAQLELPSSGHGSVPPPDYAVKTMVRALNNLLKKEQRIRFNAHTREMFRIIGHHEKGVKGFALKNIDLFKPFAAASIRKEPVIKAAVSNTITVTSISNPPGSINQIPQSISVKMDCRLLPETDKDKFMEDLRKRLNNKSIKLTIVQETIRSQPTSPEKYYATFKTALKNVYPECEVVPVLFPAFTDNNYFRQHGIPVYGINPVYLTEDLMKSIHNVNEKISKEQVLKGIDVYTTFIRLLKNQELIVAVKR